MNAVEIMDVTKKYGDRVIFDHINMEIREGEMTALIGPSGCGKSTLLNMIGLLEDLSNGKIRIFGKEIPKINMPPCYGEIQLTIFFSHLH